MSLSALSLMLGSQTLSSAGWSDLGLAPVHNLREALRTSRKIGVSFSGKYAPDDQYDHSGGGSVVEELERLNVGPSGSNSCRYWVNSVKLLSRILSPAGQYRAKPAMPEGVTTRAKARRAKWLEAPSPMKVGEDIVSSAWEHAAA